MVEKYVKYIEFAEMKFNEFDALNKAIEKLIKNNPDCFTANDLFSKAVSEESGLVFIPKDYGITKISGIVKKQCDGNLDFARFDIKDYIERTIKESINNKCKELDIFPILNEIIIDYKFTHSSYYNDSDFDAIKYILKNSNDVQSILKEVQKVKLTRKIQDCIDLYECLNTDMQEYFSTDSTSEEDEDSYDRELLKDNIQNVIDEILETIESIKSE